jgi:hypothetical protein
MMQTSSSPSRDATSAVLTLQRAWRSRFRFHTTRKVLGRFLKTNLSMGRMESTL